MLSALLPSVGFGVGLGVGFGVGAGQTFVFALQMHYSISQKERIETYNRVPAGKVRRTYREKKIIIMAPSASS